MGAIAAPSQKLIDSIDHRVILHGIAWDDYERLVAARGDDGGTRIAYLEGELELMSPSRSHQSIKTCIARLVEAWADEHEVELSGFGSWTLRSAPRERGVEPDECYIVGEPADKEFPDFAIEVVWTSGGLDKLEIYRGLGVREVWMWRDGSIEVYALRDADYERVASSELLPDLDLVTMATFLDEPSQSKAVRAFRASLRAKP